MQDQRFSNYAELKYCEKSESPSSNISKQSIEIEEQEQMKV